RSERTELSERRGLRCLTAGLPGVPADHARPRRERPPDRRMTGRRLLVVAAVQAEREAVLRGLNPAVLDEPQHWSDRNPPRVAVAVGEATVIVGGVGQAAAAATTARALAEAEAAEEPFDLVLSAGIAGGFAHRVDVGGLVLAERAVAADLGAQTPE